MQKGCIFEFSYEFDLYRDLVRELLRGQVKDNLLNKIVRELLSNHVEYVLNLKLSEYYRQSMDIMKTIDNVLDCTFDDNYISKNLPGLESDVYEITNVLSGRIDEMFAEIDKSYALWSVRSLSSFITIIEYTGDYRILEWHERAGIPYQGEKSNVRYEFSLTSLFTALGNTLQPFRGKYAATYLDRHLSPIIRNLIEEAIFLKGNRSADDNSTYLISAMHQEVIISDYPFTRELIAKQFPLMEPDQIRQVLTELLIIVETELQAAIEAAMHVDRIKSWFINDRILTIVIERPLTQVDFGERLKVDIRASIDNGDWVPPRQRNIIGC